MKKVLAMALMALCTLAFAIDTTPYFPCAVGYEWTYNDSLTSGTETFNLTTVAGETEMDGYLTYVVLQGDTASPEKNYYQIRPDGVYHIVYYAELDSMPVYMLMLPRWLNNGDIWTVFDVDTSMTVDMGAILDIRIHTTSEFVGMEDITVPAGVFSDCIKIVSTSDWRYSIRMGGTVFRSDSGVTVVNETQFAYEVGMVKDLSIDLANALMSGDYDTLVSTLLDFELTNITEKPASLPTATKLFAYPSPFNAACAIFAPSGETVEIIDISGKTITSHTGSFVWHPSSDVSAGVYFAKSASQPSPTRIIYMK